MRRLAFLPGTILLVAASAVAQLNSTPASTQPAFPSFSGPASAAQPLYAVALPAVPAPASPAAAGWPSPSPLPSAAPAEPPQGVYGVLQNFDWQLYAGYTYLRFYELPNTVLNMNGFDVSVAYYHRGGWIAAEGAMVGAFGSQSSKFVQGVGGARFRWSKPRAVELWAHGLVGGAHQSPQTPYGSQTAFGFEGGGGLDIHAHHRRISYRLEGDVLGTRFFSTYQYSPKASVGIVYKF